MNPTLRVIYLPPLILTSRRAPKQKLASAQSRRERGNTSGAQKSTSTAPPRAQLLVIVIVPVIHTRSGQRARKRTKTPTTFLSR
jgi:hypothetical protein